MCMMCEVYHLCMSSPGACPGVAPVAILCSVAHRPCMTGGDNGALPCSVTLPSIARTHLSKSPATPHLMTSPPAPEIQYLIHCGGIPVPAAIIAPYSRPGWRPVGRLRDGLAACASACVLSLWCRLQSH